MARQYQTEPRPSRKRFLTPFLAPFLAGQVRHEVAGHIAKENLQQEHFYCGYRPQFPLTPRVAGLSTSDANRFVLQFLIPTLLELRNNPCNVTLHGRASV